MSVPPYNLESRRAQPHCICMSGLTDAQLKLTALNGGLQVVEWQVVEARQTVAGPSPMGDPALHEWLLQLQDGLRRAQGRCLEHAFPQVKP